MESAESQLRSQFSPLKPKILQSCSANLSGLPGTAPWTPEKPSIQLPCSARARNKEVAKGLRRSAQIHPQSENGNGSRNLASKNSQKSPLGKSKQQIKLPEKYEMLIEFFNSMDCAIRLLQMKNSMLSFGNISRKIECLTNRRFSYGHLAQIKFILPEAIETKKIMILDEGTSSMVPVLRISLNLEALDNKPKAQSAILSLRKAFRSRLQEYVKAHPEGGDIPEETLPEPFNQSKHKTSINTGKVSPSTCQSLAISDDGQNDVNPIVASHLPVSFNRRLSKKLPRDETETLNEKMLKDASGSLSHLVSVAPLLSTPIKGLSTLSNEESEQPEEVEATPVKLCSTPATPAMQASKRAYFSPGDCSTSTPNKLVRRPPRSLKFDTPVKNSKGGDHEEGAGCSSLDNDIFDILPENILQSIIDKEKKAIAERDPALSRAKRRRDMIAALPKLFDTIHFFFRSRNRSVVTKEELVYNIITNRIVDRNEAEEQLSLLQELVPEWIHEKLALSGDCLLCINKGISPNLLRAKLSEEN